MYDWGKKRKMLVFTGVYVCVKAKLTFVSFFSSNFFFAPFPEEKLKIKWIATSNAVEASIVPHSELFFKMLLGYLVFGLLGKKR